MQARQPFRFCPWLLRWTQALGFGRVAVLGVILLSGLIISIVVFGLLKERERQLVEAQFCHLAGNRLQAVEDTLAMRLAALDWISALYASSQDVERLEFTTFTQSALARYPDLKLVGWAPRVTGAERAAQEEIIRREGLADYQIRQQTAQGILSPAEDRPTYFPIVYLNPLKNHAFLLGFDLASQPEAFNAIRRALKSKQRTLAITALPDHQGGSSSRLVLFKFAHTAPPVADTSAAPKNEGVVFAAVDLPLMVKNAVKDFTPKGIDIYLFEETAAGGTRLILSRPSSQRTDPLPPLQSLPKNPSGIYFMASFRVADHTWWAYCTPCSMYVPEQRTRAPWVALTVGAAATVLITLYLFLLLGWNRQTKALVQKRTAELTKEQQLLRRLLDLQERDRKLTAFEIHDGVAQLLTGALMKLQTLDARKEPLPPTAAELTHEAMQLMEEGNREVRRLIGGLRSPMLDELGIVPALEYLIEEQQRRHPVAIEFRHQLSRPRLAPPLEAALFRIGQESVNNAVRHSRSPRIRVELLSTNGAVRLRVQDWGDGFDPQSIRGERFGLRSIQERARLLGGAAAIQSHPGQGTTITAELPLEGPFGEEE